MKLAIVARLVAAFVLLFVGAAPGALAQSGSVNLGGSRQSVTATLLPTYQSYKEDSLTISQTSIPLSIVAPIGSNFSLSFYGAQMATKGDIPEVNGLSDAQLILSYAARLGSGSLVLGVGANLPVGKTELTEEEFTSIILVSQRAYNFRVPSLGQGYGASPSITYAVPLGGNTAIGVGAAFQVRGPYKPFGFRPDEYNPGDELLLTAGINTRLNPTSGLALDVAHSRYAADTFAGTTVYEAGSKTTISAMYRYTIRFDEVRLTAAYRMRAKNNTLVGGELVPEPTQSIPNQINLRATYRKRFNPSLQVTALVEARLFDETDLIQKRNMVDIGLQPTIRMASQASLVGRFTYTVGTITGFEAGLGIALAL